MSRLLLLHPFEVPYPFWGQNPFTYYFKNTANWLTIALNAGYRAVIRFWNGFSFYMELHYTFRKDSFNKIVFVIMQDYFWTSEIYLRPINLMRFLEWFGSHIRHPPCWLKTCTLIKDQRNEVVLKLKEDIINVLVAVFAIFEQKLKMTQHLSKCLIKSTIFLSCFLGSTRFWPNIL